MEEVKDEVLEDISGPTVIEFWNIYHSIDSKICRSTSSTVSPVIITDAAATAMEPGRMSLESYGNWN